MCMSPREPSVTEPMAERVARLETRVDGHDKQIGTLIVLAADVARFEGRMENVERDTTAIRRAQEQRDKDEADDREERAKASKKMRGALLIALVTVTGSAVAGVIVTFASKLIGG